MTGKTLKTLSTLVVVVIALTGCSNNDTTTPTGVTVDTAPPAVPVNVTGQAYDSEVMVQWNPNTTDADLAGYNVYRANGDRTAALNTMPLVATKYLDVSPIDGVNTYHVSAVDRTGNESAYHTIEVLVDDLSGPYHPDQP